MPHRLRPLTPLTPLTPLALPLPSALHFLRYVISIAKANLEDLGHEDTTPKTLLLICSPEKTFLHTLLDPPSDDLKSILKPLFSTLVASSHIRIAFTPTVQHLRVYISSLAPHSPSLGTPALLAIWGLVEVHADTTEYSAQGIGRTLASVVAAGVETGRRVVVGGRESGGRDDSNQERRAGGMDVQVPVLNSTVKLGKEMEVVARGRVNVKDIFTKWFIWKQYEDDQVEQEEEVVIADSPLGFEEQEPVVVNQEYSANVTRESEDDEL